MNSASDQLARTDFGEQTTSAAKEMAGAELDTQWLLAGIACQQCDRCNTQCYPARSICPNCLSEELRWHHNKAKGKVLSFVDLHISFNAFYRNTGIWPIGLIAHESGLNLYAFIEDETNSGEKVALFMAPDPIGQAVIIAVKESSDSPERAQKLAARLAKLNISSNKT